MSDLKDFVIKNGELTKYKGQGGDVVIPDGVTKIGDSTFYDCFSLTSVTIPEGVTKIGDRAFSCCFSLTSVTIPEGVTSIGDSTFFHCGSLTSVTIPEGMTSIGDSTFAYCSSLTSVTIPEGVTSIGNGAFGSCSSLTSVTIPESVTKIGDWAFNGCSSLTSVTIPEGVTSIGNGAFSHSSLTSITIPEGVTKIGDRAFDGCSSLTSVTIPEGVTKIGDWTFFDCSSLTNVTIPEGVTKIGDWAFNGCSSLTSVTIPEGVTKIGDRAFNGCSSLTSITLPDSVTQIGENAFCNCSSLTSITIPQSVTQIGENAFCNCSSLTSITIPQSVLKIATSAFTGCKGLADTTGAVIINDILFGYYGQNNHYIVPDGVKHIGTCAFSKNVFLESVTIPEGVISIGDNAFYGCTSLMSLTLPESAGIIEKYAFSACKNLKSLTLKGNVKSIGTDAFNNCHKSFELILQKDALVATGELTPDLCGLIKSVTAKELAFIVLYQKAKTWKEWAQVRVKGQERQVFDEMLAQAEIKKSDKPMAEYLETYMLHLTPEQVKTAVSILEKNKYKDLKKIKENSAVRGIISGKAVKEHPIEAFVRERVTKKPIPQDIMAIVPKGISYADSKLLCSREALAFIVQAYKKNDSCYEFKKKDRLEKWIDPDADKIAAALDPTALSSFALSLINNGKLHYREYMHIWGRFARGEDIDKETHDIESCWDPRWRTPNIIQALLLNESVEAMMFEQKMGKLETYASLRGKTVIALRDEVLNALIPQAEIRALVTAYEDGDQQAIIEAEKGIEDFDRDKVSAALTELVEKTGYYLGCEAWVRHANDESIRSACEQHIHMSKGKAECDALGNRFYNKLINSNTRAAMLTFEKYGELDRYAKARGMTAMEVRDTMMLPAFAIDADDKKRYDIGGNTIEVSIAPDLTFQLLDANQQKVIRSFPKKSDDPAKAEACAKDYAAFKKEVLAFAKERSKLLHRMHITGDYVMADLWRKVYIEHPVIRHLAQLIVWQDEAGKTFMIVKGESVDAHDTVCKPVGKIRVAHVADMKDQDIADWRLWLKKHGCVQLFEQVWEPVIEWKPEDITYRYYNASLTNTERNALKNSLGKRGIEMRSTGVERDVWYEHGTGGDMERRVSMGNSAQMLFGNSLTIDYTVDHETLVITFGAATESGKPGSREINTVLAEMDKLTITKQINNDNDVALTKAMLSEFTAAQISDFIDLAIDSKATRCTSVLLNYKHDHFPEYSEVNEFSLDW